MGNESPEYAALQIAVSFIDDGLDSLGKPTTDREKRIYKLVQEIANRLETEAKELENKS